MYSCGNNLQQPLTQPISTLPLGILYPLSLFSLFLVNTRLGLKISIIIMTLIDSIKDQQHNHTNHSFSLSLSACPFLPSLVCLCMPCPSIIIMISSAGSNTLGRPTRVLTEDASQHLGGATCTISRRGRAYICIPFHTILDMSMPSGGCAHMALAGPKSRMEPSI